jgi:hypothetical protein
MPGFDRSGPMGSGPMTGGARGFCNPAATGYQAPFYRGAGYGRGMGFGRGFRGGMGRGMSAGFGRGYGWNPYLYAPSSPNAMDAAGELEMLKTQAASMKSALDSISKRMAELQKSPE